MSKVNTLNETLPQGRSSGLVKTLVCFMNPHTHCASAPPSAYQGENSQGQESEPQDSEMVRTRVRKEKEVTDLYQPPHPLWIPPTSHPTEKSKLHLLTAFMIAQHADEWKLPQVLSGGRQQARPCVYSRNRWWWPYAPESERNIRSQSKTVDAGLPCQLATARFTVAPFQTGRHLCSQPHALHATEGTCSHTQHKQIPNTDLPSQKVLMCCCCFPICVHTGCLWVFSVGMHYVLREKKKDCILSCEDRSSVVWKQCVFSPRIGFKDVIWVWANQEKHVKGIETETERGAAGGEMTAESFAIPANLLKLSPPFLALLLFNPALVLAAALGPTLFPVLGRVSCSCCVSILPMGNGRILQTSRLPVWEDLRRKAC